MAVDVENKPTPQAFGSSGGKFHLAKKISAMMPEHKTYVEPYAGGAAVYFYKEPAEKEVLNDMDKEIAFAYRFIRDMTPEQYKALQKKDWVISRERFDKVKAMKPATDVDRFYKFYYLKKASYRYMNDSFNIGQVGRVVGIDRLPRVQSRLRGVAVNAGDALKMIDKYDSKDTIFYLDPPYPETAPIGGNAPRFCKEDLEKLIDRLEHIRGRFILSMDTANAKMFPRQFNTQRVVTKGRDGDGQWVNRTEVLATNFKVQKPKRKRLKLKRRRNGHRELTPSLMIAR